MKAPHMFLLLAAAAATAAAPAWGARPANLAGTTWTVQINGTSEQLVITHQGGTGTAGGPACLRVQGTIGRAPVRGGTRTLTPHLPRADGPLTGVSVASTS